MYHESARIAFLEARDGKTVALEWAERTLGLYVAALHKPRHRFIRPIRISLYLSIRYFRRYLAENA